MSHKQAHQYDAYPSKRKWGPILSFDFAQFLENGERMNREQILSRLALDHLVLHSMPPLGRGQGEAHDQRVIEAMPGIFTYRNPYWLPRIYGKPALERLLASARALHRLFILSRFDPRPPILYVWHPFFYEEVGRYRERAVVYHIYDDYRLMPNQPKDIARWEKKLLAKADLVFCSSRSTAKERERESGREVVFLPNAVDYEMYERARFVKNPCPKDLEAISRPRLAYIGRMNKKVDFELLFEIAKLRPQWNIVLVGPIVDAISMSISLKKLEKLANVHFLGRKFPEELPDYYMHIDVSLMAYRNDPEGWYSKIYPLKLHEALAIGKPVVSTRLAEVLEFSEIIEIATTPGEWVAAVEKILQADGEWRVEEERRAIAKQNTWDSRVTQIKAHLEALP